MSGGTSHWFTIFPSTYETSSPLTGARSILINTTAVAQSVSTWPTFAGAGIVVFRFRIRFSTLPNASIALGTDNSTLHAGAYFNASDSKIYAGTSASALGATGVSVTTDVTYYIDVRVNRTANPWLVDVQVNGTACGQRTTTQAAFTTAQTVRLGDSVNASTYSAVFDDVIVSVTSGDYPIGDGYVNHFVPTSDGTHNIAGTGDFRRTLTATDILNATTTAYQLVDDVPLEEGAGVDWINMLLPVNATDYVECVFGPAPGISTPTVAPRAVEVICGIHHAGTGAGNMEIRLNDNGSMGTVYTATAVAGVTSIAYKRVHFADPPSAASAWVIGGGGDGDFTNLRVQFGSPAVLDVNPDQYFDCIMIEAEFAPVIPALDPSAYGRPSGQRGQNEMKQLLSQ